VYGSTKKLSGDISTTPGRGAAREGTHAPRHPSLRRSAPAPPEDPAPIGQPKPSWCRVRRHTLLWPAPAPPAVVRGLPCDRSRRPTAQQTMWSETILGRAEGRNASDSASAQQISITSGPAAGNDGSGLQSQRSVRARTEWEVGHPLSPRRTDHSRPDPGSQLVEAIDSLDR
jgi:hypothetical protein